MKMRGFLLARYCSQLAKAARLVHALRPLCTRTYDSKAIAVKPVRDDDTYRHLENLDFMTAAKMLFTDPPKKKEFGLDFHLVQFLFCCLPSVAIYMVAQYARYEIRRMEAEADVKKKKDEGEEKTEGLEANASKESEEAELEALEEALKGIVVEKKKNCLHIHLKKVTKTQMQSTIPINTPRQPSSHERAADSRSKRGGEAAEKGTHPKK
ncbi:hypothetical protein MKX01_010318 [Papaver californicum]|nr:hypothetical protein MKX01_010318 [Papaver californicum]